MTPRARSLKLFLRTTSEYSPSSASGLSYVEAYGLPVAIYLDKFSTYKVNHKNAVDNKEFMTQFERAMTELGVQVICANSPEAKGRVERLFGTLQDRMVKEMRLADVKKRDEAK